MILTELKGYIEDNGIVSRADLAKKFSMSEDGVDAMLNVWIKKGIISRTIDTNKAHHVTRVRYALNRNDGLSLTVTL
ncbi:FeoC-like transcriptional regulator [Vibrio aestuarianus]|uniref:FeoC-like transcriptional regulator n=1 Tax=Vibrio aestuarianus TaxID=28171 RepID=A0A9X4ERK2_9VIBR|nr:FeoC-like transcriptional regulator [Vibrio aestuarianus]MDE1214133.1 FeoC-like transcriptional regulator [Vibrio aestuarianus]MDE1216342.1 FeoC-like transcriptional regulator [Vibrio aestuarianus]MDE1221238.1 FeoC-like transcriptional regulator [Vibrio aestuarianus]MDE1227645.1 FeoC-like transcriptional regulator [Vibrio aestuarianus]MDE1238420.1 FeoC-like transcriptional regulator [Vibrio aestuarianus]